MTYNEIISLVKERKSFLCIGLDSDPQKIPQHLHKYDDPVFEFNKQIVDATIDLSLAYKPNLAFYESSGLKGWQSLDRTIKYIRSLKKEIFLIADAKRGDIGNTSKQYAKAFFEMMDFEISGKSEPIIIVLSEPFVITLAKEFFILFPRFPLL